MTKLQIVDHGDTIKVIAPKGSITPEVRRALLSAKRTLKVFAPAVVEYTSNADNEQRRQRA